LTSESSLIAAVEAKRVPSLGSIRGKPLVPPASDKDALIPLPSKVAAQRKKSSTSITAPKKDVKGKPAIPKVSPPTTKTKDVDKPKVRKSESKSDTALRRRGSKETIEHKAKDVAPVLKVDEMLPEHTARSDSEENRSPKDNSGAANQDDAAPTMFERIVGPVCPASVPMEQRQMLPEPEAVADDNTPTKFEKIDGVVRPFPAPVETRKIVVSQPAKDADVKSPDVKIDVKSPDIKCDVKSPDVKSDVKSPDVKSDVKSPDVKNDVKSPKEDPDDKPAVSVYMPFLPAYGT